MFGRFMAWLARFILYSAVLDIIFAVVFYVVIQRDKKKKFDQEHRFDRPASVYKREPLTDEEFREWVKDSVSIGPILLILPYTVSRFS